MRAAHGGSSRTCLLRAVHRADVFMDRPEQEDEQRLREAMCGRRSAGICCHDSPHGEAVDSRLRAFHTVSLGTLVDKPVHTFCYPHITASSDKNHSFGGCAGCLWLLPFRGSAKENEICWDNRRAPKRHSMAAESENRLRECLIGELLGTSSRRSCKNLPSSRSGEERQKPLRASSLSARVPCGGAPLLRR